MDDQYVAYAPHVVLIVCRLFTIVYELISKCNFVLLENIDPILPNFHFMFFIDIDSIFKISKITKSCLLEHIDSIFKIFKKSITCVLEGIDPILKYFRKNTTVLQDFRHPSFPTSSD